MTTIDLTPALNETLNQLLDGEFTPGRFRDHLIFESARADEASLQVIGFDESTGLGLAESFRTGYRVAFQVIGQAKPLAKRDMRPELDLDVFEIDTVVDERGMILGALGETRGRGWRLVGSL